MGELLGLSFDAPASPEISFTATDPAGAGGPDRPGWGMAWYPSGELAARTVHDPYPADRASLATVLHDWDRFRTTLVVGQLRGAAKRHAHRDTQPFVRMLGGRTWTMAHAGELRAGYEHALALPPGPEYAAAGPTDSEHLFAWLLARAAAHGASSLAELGYGTLHRLLLEANRHGPVTVLLADGTDLVAYQDLGGAGPLWWRRIRPPGSTRPLAGEGVGVVNSGVTDAYRTMVVVSDLAFGGDPGQPLAGGQLLVIRRGSVVEDRPAPTGLEVAPVTAATPTPPPAPRLLEVTHRTVYTYDRPVERSSHRFRLSPVSDEFQHVLHHELDIVASGSRYRFEDVFGNQVNGFEVTEPFTELVVTARSVVEVGELVDRPQLLPRPSVLPPVWMPWQRQMMHAYLMPPELPEDQLEELGAYGQGFAERNRFDLLATLDDLNATIHRDYLYRPGFTTLETTPFDVYVSRHGVCQDFANLMICLARLLGIPARYRVGYIYTGTDYANTVQSEASHAWVEVYLPMMGWRGYDPTNGARAGRDHIRVACGRNFRDATPTAGVIRRGGGGETLRTEVLVEQRPFDR